MKFACFGVGVAKTRTPVWEIADTNFRHSHQYKQTFIHLLMLSSYAGHFCKNHPFTCFTEQQAFQLHWAPVKAINASQSWWHQSTSGSGLSWCKIFVTTKQIGSYRLKVCSLWYIYTLSMRIHYNETPCIVRDYEIGRDWKKNSYIKSILSYLALL